ncbi:glucan endo-1,3-beta-glucosidase-like [Salvia miltiorrhiza]|uniref:glucan endo-1,3-beta-glucosidase-like n=1 Tax=Salvia miltiorrhiza TaxID=226208 RepID=UPI0025ACE898|nr:glucan endo-1,3-beta-glucosidase-like [Salvia miltiorrhiza]
MATTTMNHFNSAMLVFGLLATLSLDFTVGEIGVCYGRNGNNLLSPRQVVDLYKRHNIRRMRTYDPDNAILDALRGSGIELNVVITNQYIQRIAADANAANDWVRDHVLNFPDVDLKYISVGNEVSPADGATSRYAQFVLPAMRNIYRAVCRAGRAGRTKITTTIGMNALGNSFPPEDGAFRDDVAPYLRPILSFMVGTDAPFMANIYPYFAYIYNKNQIDLGYALLEPDHGIQVNGVYYDNLFYAMVDAVYAAVERMIGPSLQTTGNTYNQTSEQKARRGRKTPKVVVTETGHPSAGGDSANMHNAKTYNQNLADVVDEGTPRHPEPIETYIFALFDENEKPGAETERNFGVFYPDGQPKYDMNFN